MPRLVNLANFQQFTAINVLTDPGVHPGPVEIPNCAVVRLQWADSTGKPHYNILHGRYAGSFALTQANANTVLTGLTSGAQWTTLATFLANTAGLVGVQFRDLAVRDQPLIPSTVLGANGTSASPELPAETALALTLRTAFTGPANRGRMYIPGWATNALGANNVVAAAAVTAVGNWGSTIAGILSGVGLTFVLAHPQRDEYTGSTGTVHPARPAGTIPVVTVSVRDNHWDSQRRRGLK